MLNHDWRGVLASVLGKPGIEMQGGVFRVGLPRTDLQVTLDGRTLFSATDSAIPGPGRVGVWTKSDSVTHFDALEAEARR